MLLDQHARVHTYLRISLTDSCNFRCSYCMPDEDIETMPSSHLMQIDEIETIAKKFVQLGVTKIRLTGGEPMVRKDFAEIIERLSCLPVELTLTTNGILVDKYIDVFKKNGIKSLNVSLDTLQEDVFFKLTKRNQFKKVKENILLLLKEGFRVKINVVALNGIIENELLDFVSLTKDLPLHVRFIEFMPFAGNLWNKEKVMTAKKMIGIIEQKFDIIKIKDLPHDTAKKYKVTDHLGTFAFITTMSENFCDSCNRMRITADGKMKNCLFGKDELDLLGQLRQGKDIESVIRLSLHKKSKALGGQFSNEYEQADASKIENRSMIRIGG